MSVAETVKQRALKIGFDLAGVAPVEVWNDLEFSRRWVERGYAGEMRYLENSKRHDPRRILPSAKSVVCVGLVYNADLPYSTEVGRGGPWPPGREGGKRKAEGTKQDEEIVTQATADSHPVAPRAWISRYAWGRDYHEGMRTKLEELRAAIESLSPGVETRVYVDTGPVVERAFARYSGIGWMGKNTCLINEDKGSWFFLGVILTSLSLGPDLPAPDRCGSCTRCIDACPTGALVEPYVMDASRCIAYFTIELRGSIPVEHRASIGSNVFGCDICQDVCPWNSMGSGQPSGAGDRHQAGTTRDGRTPRKAATTDEPEFQPMTIELSTAESPTAGSGCPAPGPRSPAPAFSLFNPRLDDLARLSEEDFRCVFAHSPIKRAKFRGWLRNLCVVMGNSGERRFTGWLERLARHDDPVVREHAEWALGRLAGAGECHFDATPPLDEGPCTNSF